MNFITQTSIIILIVISFNCSKEPVVINPESVGYYYVESIISPDIDIQGVIVGKTIPEHLPEDISGARVWMEGENKSVRFFEGRPGIYLDKYQQLNVIPGQKYTLHVKLPDSTHIYGSTYVPGDFKILYPTEQDTITYRIGKFKGDVKEYPGSSWCYPFIVDSSEVPHLIWSRSDDALVYRIQTQINHEKFISYTTATVDTNIYFPDIIPTNRRELPDTINWFDNIPVEFKITAYDTNQIFTDYEPRSYWRDSDLCLHALLEEREWENKIPNMEGGKGFFGAYTVIKKRIIVRISMEWP